MLIALFVDPDYARQGIGRSLFEHARRIILTILAFMTLGGGFMGIYGAITQLQAWQADPVSVVVALLLSVLLAWVEVASPTRY